MPRTKTKKKEIKKKAVPKKTTKTKKANATKKKTAAKDNSVTKKKAIKIIKEPDRPKKVKVRGIFAVERVIAENSDASREFYNQSSFGKPLENGKLQLSLCEGLYLMEKGKLEIFDRRNSPIDFESYIRKARKAEPNFWIRYCVFKNMRNRGYVIKTALKFGADFRVYDRGVKPGEDHARWIIYPVHEGNILTWYEFAAKNRVAHSTKKRLLIGIVDDEGDVTYYEIRWTRP